MCAFELLAAGRAQPMPAFREVFLILAPLQLTQLPPPLPPPPRRAQAGRQVARHRELHLKWSGGMARNGWSDFGMDTWTHDKGHYWEEWEQSRGFTKPTNDCIITRQGSTRQRDSTGAAPRQEGAHKGAS